jgi:hypothetical protein
VSHDEIPSRRSVLTDGALGSLAVLIGIAALAAGHFPRGVLPILIGVLLLARFRRGAQARDW